MKSNKTAKEIMNTLLDEDFINPHVKLVKVCWKDAHTCHDTLNIKEVVQQKLLPAETIGYLLYEDDDVYVVCGFWFWDEETDILDENSGSAFREVHTIPKSQVSNVLVLKIDFEETKKYREEAKK